MSDIDTLATGNDIAGPNIEGGKPIVWSAHVVPLTEAAAFTFGYAVLRTRWFDPQRVGIALVAIAALLTTVLLIVLTPEGVVFDPSAFDPSAVLGPTTALGSP